MLKLEKWRIGAILLALVILTGAIAGASFASSDQQNNNTLSDMYQSFVSKLAANLGIEQSVVTAALDTTKKQMLDEAVQQGKITQEYADRISSNSDWGFCGGIGFLNGKFKGQGKFKGEGFAGKGPNLNGIASILGITADELKAEMESGKNVEQIATEHGMTMDQIHEKMLELKKTEISQAVTDGKISQEQADKMLQRLEQGPKGQGFERRGHRGAGYTSNNNE
ncbi:MAG: hypothetical protein A4E55_00945 [Pelotomaculum sp. PtaU1.Bin035]|nr:MAG: hypothetical protein A4E55_00945 [Pelotomaculum sp. PtaU1.Bin035]